jgi:hypothetical protein
VFNWLSDFEMALDNAGQLHPEFLHERVSFCRTFIERFARLDELMVENFKRALADSLLRLGCGPTDALYSQWLREDPQWGWGWIGWSDDSYLFAPEGLANPDRAVELLLEGLQVPGVRDRRDMLERLVDLCEELGRTKDIADAVKELRELDMQPVPPALAGRHSNLRASPLFESTGSRPLADDATGSEDVDLPLRGNSTRRVGRNEPCPCGSGKKYKKCCMQRAE